MEKITVQEAAKRMHKTPQFVRLGLQQGIFSWGVAIKTSSQWSYWINPVKFAEAMGMTVEELMKEIGE